MVGWCPDVRSNRSLPLALMRHRPSPMQPAVVQVKVWLLGISPMVWRRLLVPDTCTLRELHGMIQVAMGWEGIHPYPFCLRSAVTGRGRCRPPRLTSRSAALKLRRGARFTHEYDLNIPWRHEVKIEESRLNAEPGKVHPRCIAGDGACFGGAEAVGPCAGPVSGVTGLVGAEVIRHISESIRDWYSNRARQQPFEPSIVVIQCY